MCRMLALLPRVPKIRHQHEIKNPSQKINKIVVSGAFMDYK